MKYIKPVSILLGLSIYSNETFSQNCKVLMHNISDTYTGKCKKGLANGKGTASGVDTYTGKFRKGYPNGFGKYTWANGNYYEGTWKMGKKDGEGTLHIKENKKYSLLSGIWEKDKYVGKKPKKPKILRKENISSYSIRKIGDDTNKIEIRIMNTGGKGFSKLNIYSSTGSINGLYIENIKYPVNVNIEYLTPSLMNSYMLRVQFEFTIEDPGDWLVILRN